jgi:hypothetical protein
VEQTFNPQGNARDRDRALLAALALLTIADIRAASARWDRYAPRGFQGLMLASLTRGPSGTFFFDPAHVAYGIAGRGYIAAPTLRAAVDAYATASAGEFSSLASQAAAGSMDVSVWQDVTSVLVKQHLAVMTGIGAGGVNNVDVSDLLLGSNTIKFQLGRLDLFAAQMIAGDKTANTVDKVTRRAGTYALSGVMTFEEVRRNTAIDTMTEERRVLTPADHCRTCIEQAALAWRPIGTLKPIGDSECMWNCKCYFLYRKPMP